jgi:MSHA biogenesis protein MshQ
VTLASGSGLLSLAAPAPTASGSLALALNLGSTAADQSCTSGLAASSGAGLPWLRALNGACSGTPDRDPAAQASFGIFSPESRRTVHVRELF